MSKAKKTTAIIFATFFAIIGIFLLAWYFGDSYPQFYKLAQKEFVIPGLSAGFIPQGLCYEDSTGQFITSGYMKNGSASRFYVVDAQTNKTTKYFTLKNGEEAYTGHAGGIETDGENVWVVGDGFLFRFKFEDVQNIENKGEILIIDSFKTNNGADFVTLQDDKLWVGEFHREGKYDTDPSHFVETKTGTNKAVNFCYQIDNFGVCGLQSTIPIKAMSTGSLVQGMVITNEKIVLSTSYSLPNSHIYIYKNSTAQNTFDYNGTQIEMLVLEDENLIQTITAPCMSEEITLKQNKIFVLFESACKKYGFVTREALKNVYSFEI